VLQQSHEFEKLAQFLPLLTTGRSQHVQSLVAHEQKVIDLAVLNAAFQWFKRFKDWHEKLHYDTRSRSSLTSRNADTIENC
jgi:predicted LPLAT superfamily acyltransferase